MADEETFVSRWSRRKRDARVEEEATASVPASEAQNTVPAESESPEDESPEGESPEGDREVVAALPDIESLDETSDFTPFMAKGVPEALRRRALRKLWRLNPAFAQLDGLNDYDEDFTDAAVALLSQVKTVYKVGKGMVSEPDAEEESAPQEGSAPQKESAPQEESAPEEAEQGRPETAELDERPADQEAPEAPAQLQDELQDKAEDGAVAEPRDSARRSAAARRWGESPE